MKEYKIDIYEKVKAIPKKNKFVVLNSLISNKGSEIFENDIRTVTDSKGKTLISAMDLSFNTISGCGVSGETLEFNPPKTGFLLKTKKERSKWSAAVRWW